MRQDDIGHGSPSDSMCMSEAWTGDLSNGLLCLGERARIMHGLDTSECGLLSMMRSYDAGDRGSILKLFEQAATRPSHFCYSTTIIGDSNLRRPVFCIGQSNGFDQNEGGKMHGVFIFPNFQCNTNGTTFGSSMTS
nr:hypothetical protein [Peteryoungia desertarenae]